MADVMSDIQYLIQDELPRVMYESFPDVVGFADQIDRTVENVKHDINRGWQVHHIFDTGIAGLIKYADPMGMGTTSITGGQVGLLLQGTAATNRAPFPNAAESPYPGIIKRDLTLHKIVGNFPIALTWMQAATLDTAIWSQVARIIKGVGKLYAKVEAVNLFGVNATNSATYKTDVLGRITSVTETVANYPDIVLNEAYGTIHNFRPGDKIDIVDSIGDTLQTTAGANPATDGSEVINYDGSNVYVQLVVTSVDLLNKTIRVAGFNNTTGLIQTYAGSGWGAALPAAGDWIVSAGCSTYASATRPLLSWGLEHWIGSSGTILGGNLDLDTYPQFKSSIVAVNAPLTEGVLNRYIAGFMEAYPDANLDTFVTTQGVTMKFLEQPALNPGRFNYDRTGKSLNVVGGWSKIDYEFNGKKMQWFTNPFCAKNRLYCIKLSGGNLKRYAPPKIGGSDARIGEEIEFLGPVAGYSGIFMGAVDGNGYPQDYVQAPFWQYRLTAPMDVRSVKLTGLTESVLV